MHDLKFCFIIFLGVGFRQRFLELFAFHSRILKKPLLTAAGE